MEDMNVEQLYKVLETSIETAAKNSRTKDENTRRSSKLKESTLKLIDQREIAKLTMNDSDGAKREYDELNKRTKRTIREDIRSHKIDIIRQIMIESKSTRKMKKELSNGKHWMLGVKDDKGKRIASRAQISAQATKFYKDLYSSTLQRNNSTTLDSNQRTANDEDKANTKVPEIIRSEVRTAIAEIKTNKSPGEDGILNEYLKIGEETLIAPIIQLFNKILDTEDIPTAWKRSGIILLHQKGPKDEINNYRPISLMPNIYKLFMKIITK